MNRVPYCPRDGCGMSNGAAPPVIVICKFCKTTHYNFDKICPHCKKCHSCNRIAKKYYEN